MERRDPKPDVVVVKNVSSSGCGVGSGDFHTYRKYRRFEMERQKQLDADEAHQIAEETYMERKAKLKAEDDAVLERNRRKRQKKKEAKQRARKRAKEGESSEPNPVPETEGDEKEDIRHALEEAFKK